MNQIEQPPDILTDVSRDGGADAFRRVWRGYASGVSLIATEEGGTRYAMLATAVTSVSMDPPSLLICVNRSASAHAALAARGAFSLGVLGAVSEPVATAIAVASSAGRFDHGTWRQLAPAEGALARLPWLAEAQATLFCAIDKTCDYGTHSVFIARVLRLTGEMGTDPLVYCDGAMRRTLKG